MTDAHDASEEAIHKAKSAQAAVENARELQQEELVEKTAQKTKEALLEGLKEVFSNDSNKSPQDMKVLIQRVPILCTTVIQMHEDIGELKDSVKWATRIVIGAFLTIVTTVIIAGLKIIFMS